MPSVWPYSHYVAGTTKLQDFQPRTLPFQLADPRPPRLSCGPSWREPRRRRRQSERRQRPAPTAPASTWSGPVPPSPCDFARLCARLPLPPDSASPGVPGLDAPCDFERLRPGLPSSCDFRGACASAPCAALALRFAAPAPSAARWGGGPTLGPGSIAVIDTKSIEVTDKAPRNCELQIGLPVLRNLQRIQAHRVSHGFAFANCRSWVIEGGARWASVSNSRSLRRAGADRRTGTDLRDRHLGDRGRPDLDPMAGVRIRGFAGCAGDVGAVL